MEVMEQHVHKPPPVPHEIDGSIPLAMSDLIFKLLDKDPARRPDAKTVKADLKAAAKELRAATTQVGRVPQNPNVSGQTILHGPPTPIVEEAALPDAAPPPAAPVPAVQSSWISRNWPWLIGGLALTWLLTVALYLLLQRPPLPDQAVRTVPAAAKPETPQVAPMPDTTGADEAAEKAEKAVEPVKADAPPAPETRPAPPERRPSKRNRK
jgi:serine/threonine-protein kinase